MLTHSYLENYIAYNSSVEGFDTILNRLKNTDIIDRRIVGSSSQPSLDPITKKVIIPEVTYSYTYHGNLYKKIKETSLFNNDWKRDSIVSLYNRLFSPEVNYRDSGLLRYNIRQIYFDYEDALSSETFDLTNLNYFNDINKSLFDTTGIIDSNTFSNDRQLLMTNFLKISGKYNIFNNNDDLILEAILNKDILITEDDIEAFLKILASEIVTHINYSFASEIKELEEKLVSISDPDPNSFKKVKDDLSDYLDNFKRNTEEFASNIKEEKVSFKTLKEDTSSFFSEFWGKLGSAIFNNGNIMSNADEYTDSLETGIQDLWDVYYQIYLETKKNFKDYNIFPIICSITNEIYQDLNSKELRDIRDIKLFQLVSIIKNDFMSDNISSTSEMKITDIINSAKVIQKNYDILKGALLERRFTL